MSETTKSTGGVGNRLHGPVGRNRKMDVHFSSKTEMWATPQKVFDELNDEFGPLDLDVCAVAENAKCADFYSLPKDDGLKRKWRGSVWCNPPYKRGVTGLWTARAVQQIRYKRVQRIAMLIPVSTDTIWWHKTVMCAQELRFINGRLRFEGAERAAPQFASVIVIYDHRSWPTIQIGKTINARGKH